MAVVTVTMFCVASYSHRAHILLFTDSVDPADLNGGLVAMGVALVIIGIVVAVAIWKLM